MLPGRGVRSVVNGHTILAGNPQLFRENDIALPDPLKTEAASCLKSGCTVIYIALDRRTAGFIALSDTLREDAALTIDEVIGTGVTPVLLTGDHANAAKHIAEKLR